MFKSLTIKNHQSSILVQDSDSLLHSVKDLHSWINLIVEIMLPNWFALENCARLNMLKSSAVDKSLRSDEFEKASNGMISREVVFRDQRTVK